MIYGYVCIILNILKNSSGKSIAQFKNFRMKFLPIKDIVENICAMYVYDVYNLLYSQQVTV